MGTRTLGFDHKSLRSKAFGGSFAKQRAERSECRDEHHCASEFNPLLRKKTVLRKGYVFFVKEWEREPSGSTTKVYEVKLWGEALRSKEPSVASSIRSVLVFCFIPIKSSIYKGFKVFGFLFCRD